MIYQQRGGLQSHFGGPFSHGALLHLDSAKWLLPAVPCHKLLMAQSTVSSLPIIQSKCLIIKLPIQVVTAVTNHNKAYNRHTWVDTNHRLTTHRPDRSSKNATAQSGAWEARHAIPECISLDRLSQGALQNGTE